MVLPNNYDKLVQIKDMYLVSLFGISIVLSLQNRNWILGYE